ncbi:hypothetical protein IFM89_005772 [Coptis chinensis]|uniref:RING-type domain-containing protein n=1 Tax=Coptis chinensis TaxID=261450 RepID=A0A835IMC8_9MAGN|nr:hypothetical protein IFM89_005772 [Coptis chinensis]
MGSACCVAARDRNLLPSRTSSEALSRNVRFSPTWNCRWDNQGRVADEVEDITSADSHVGFESKDSLEVEFGDLSETRSEFMDIHTEMLHKSSSRRQTGGSSMASGTDTCMRSSSLSEVKDLKESAAVADSLALILPVSIPVASTSSLPIGDSSSRCRPLPAEFTPSWKARHSPGYSFNLQRQVSDGQSSVFKSPNNSISEGRQSISTCSNDLTVGSRGGGSSDGWSMSTFSELVASSQRERWSFDSETLDSSRGKVTRSNSNVLASHSTDLRTCGVCLKLLMERSPWVAQKLIVGVELSVVAVLVCGHVYHAECLENTTSETNRFDPPCPVCTTGDKQALKKGKTVKIDIDSKARNRISRNRVVDSNIHFDYTVPDHWISTRREGKGPKLGSSSSMKSSFAKPFLRRHFSLGSKSAKSILDNEFTIKSPSRKGFWARYRKG